MCQYHDLRCESLGKYEDNDMASTSTSGTLGQMVKPEYTNWLAVGHALTTVLCQGLRPFVMQEMEIFYRNVRARVVGPCTCFYVPSRRPNQFHDMRSCLWAKVLTTCHRSKPNWKQSDSAKWMDPVVGPWEIAKLFLPELGGHADIKSANDMDINSILNLMYWCKHFTIPQPLIKDVRDVRNDKCVHVPKLELSDADKSAAFDAIENLLQDTQLAADEDAKKALGEVISLKSIKDLHNREPQILADLKEVMNERVLNLTEETERNKKMIKELQESLEMAFEDLERFNRPLPLRVLGWVFQLLVYVLGILYTFLKGKKTEMLFFIVFSCFCGVLDYHSTIKDVSLGPYQSIGCYKDFNDRAIPTLEGQDSILDSNYNARSNSIEKCYKAAKKRGFQVFAVQNGGWCASTAITIGTFTRYGKSSACKSDGEGGPWANQVYYIKGYQAVGCYTDASNRAVETLEGTDSILDGAYNSRVNPIAKCAVAAMRKGYNMFAVQDGGWCAASSTAPQTFDKYGKSTTCKGDGKGGPWANNVYVVNPLVLPYETIGCFQDHDDRALPTLEGQDPILDGDYKTRLDPISKCFQAAKKRGFHIFAIQDGGWCATSASAAKTFNRYGKSSACKSDGEGGPWANQVYYIKGYKAVGCYKNNSNDSLLDMVSSGIETLEGKDSSLDDAYNSRENPIANCAVATMRNGYSMFAVQNGGWCAASAAALEIFDKYGESTDCEANGSGGPAAYNIYLLKGYVAVGCYREKQDRAIDTLEGKDSILNDSYYSRENPIAKCAVAAMRKGYSIFAVQDGGLCAAGVSALQKFDKYGKSTNCEVDGTGGPGAINVYLMKEYEDVGCYKDKQSRAIETLEGKDSILDGAYNSRENPITKCAVAAMRKGYSMFAIQNGGWCAASSTAQEKFDVYGKSTDCMADGEGGPWANNVYILRDAKNVRSHDNSSSHMVQPLKERTWA